MVEDTDLVTQAASADSAVGLRAVRALRLLAERLEARHVQRGPARPDGRWQDIAEQLGVTRQAAQQKHGRDRVGPLSRPRPARRG